jgi:hypothetical protein
MPPVDWERIWADIRFNLEEWPSLLLDLWPKPRQQQMLALLLLPLAITGLILMLWIGGLLVLTALDGLGVYSGGEGSPWMFVLVGAGAIVFFWLTASTIPPIVEEWKSWRVAVTRFKHEWQDERRDADRRAQERRETYRRRATSP